MKKIGLVIFVFALGILFSSAISQELPKKVLFKLESYKKPTENNFVEGSELSNIIWTVYSDRSNNISYTEPGSGIIKNNLEFMDAFCVLGENNGFLWLIEPEFVDENGYVLSDATDYGWVAKNKMLLWSNCLITDECNLNKKAMILNTIDAFRERIEDVEFAKFYYDPQLQDATQKKSSVYKIYSVYKSRTNSVLLGKKSSFSNEFDGKSTIVGWVKKSRITPWDHRLAIEPNWDSKAVSQRRLNEIRLKFFEDLNEAIEYSSTGDTTTASNMLWQENPYYTERKIGYFPRFPVLSDLGDSLHKVGIIDKMTSATGSMSTDSSSVAVKRIEDWAKAKKNINFVFVVDGSTSMQPYFKPVANAIKTSMSKLSEKTNNIFRFAAVVYRDYKEGSRTIESISLKSDYNKTANFLDNISAKNVFDLDTPEAVNLGLKNAILGVGLNKKETNVIVLVGDAGNHHRDDETQVSENEIINLLHNYECHFLAFQVHHASHIAYKEFNDQAKNIILDLANKTYDSIASVGVELTPPALLPEENGIIELNETAIVAFLATCQKNKTVSPDEIETGVEHAIVRINKFIDDLKNLLITVVEEGDEYEHNSLGPAFFYALKSAGLSDEEITFYCARNSQMYYEGYGSIINNKVEERLTKYVLLMDKVELTTLLDIFTELLNASSYNDRRKKMKEAWLDILRKHIGDSDEIDLELLNLGSLSSKVLCLPNKSEFLKVPLIDITDPKKLSDYEFDLYVKSINDKRNALRKIYNNTEYKYLFLSDDKTYYWIEEDLLP